MKKILFITTIILSLTFCSTWDTRLVLVNNTQNRISYDFDIMDIKDTLPSLEYCKESKPYYINSMSEKRIQSQNNFDGLKNPQDPPEEILRIFIIEEDTLTKYGFCTVYKNPKLYKRIDLTYDDMVKANWRVVYNGK